MFYFEEVEHFRTMFTSQGVKLNVNIDFRLLYIAFALTVLSCFSSFFPLPDPILFILMGSANGSIISAPTGI